jgi:hypothetical protein
VRADNPLPVLHLRRDLQRLAGAGDRFAQLTVGGKHPRGHELHEGAPGPPLDRIGHRKGFVSVPGARRERTTDGADGLCHGRAGDEAAQGQADAQGQHVLRSAQQGDRLVKGRRRELAVPAERGGDRLNLQCARKSEGPSAATGRFSEAVQHFQRAQGFSGVHQPGGQVALAERCRPRLGKDDCQVCRAAKEPASLCVIPLGPQVAQGNEAFPFAAGVTSGLSQVNGLLEVGPGTLEVTEQMASPGAAEI